MPVSRSGLFVLLLGLALSAGVVCAQTGPDPRWARFTPENSGLADLRTTDIVEAFDGSMWFVHPGAVSRFDGRTWRTFPADIHLPADSSETPDAAPEPPWAQFDLALLPIHRVVEDMRGALWFATDAGVFRLDPDRWENGIPAYRGMALYQVHDVLRDSYGVLWFAAYDPVSGEGSLSGLDPGGRWLFFNAEVEGLASNDVIALAEDQYGGLWAGTVNSGVSRYLGSEWQTWTAADGDGALPDDRILDVQAAEGGRVVVVVTEGGAVRYDVDSGVWAAAGDAALAAPRDPGGMVWASTAGGLVRTDPDDGRSVLFNTGNSGMAENSARYLTEDNGLLVFGTDRVYVTTYRPDPPARPMIAREMPGTGGPVVFNVTTEAWWPAGALTYRLRLDGQAVEGWHQIEDVQGVAVAFDPAGLEAGEHTFCARAGSPLLDMSPETCARFVTP
ncbi:MAG: hypothetical protein JXB47_02420 [Anaerolineae bacterium]|nr:hypothetical protein [Anaerolineae bacterium]